MTLPGVSCIFGLIPCTNPRYVLPNKPRTVTMDAEIVLYVTPNEDVLSLPALLRHFCTDNEDSPVDNALYYVAGKISSTLDPNDKEMDDSDEKHEFVIDAEVLHLLPQGFYKPICPSVVAAGVARNKTSDHDFLLDIKQFVYGKQRVSGHLCHFPESRRFDKVPMPSPNRFVEVMGVMTRDPVSTSSNAAMKRMAINILDIALLGPDSGAVPQHGNSPSGSNRVFKYSWGQRGGEAGPSKVTAKKEDDKETLPSDDGKVKSDLTASVDLVLSV